MSSHFKTAIENKQAQAKEDKAKWAKDKPGREPGTSLATWKTYSKQKYPSRAFREGWEDIDWGKS